jgi:hypothetical protein
LFAFVMDVISIVVKCSLSGPAVTVVIGICNDERRLLFFSYQVASMALN